LERRNAEAPRNPETLEALAGSYALGARYYDAIRITRELIALQPANPAWRMRLAKLHAWNGETDRALAEVRAMGDSAGLEAVELECRLLSWNSDARGAAACYMKLLRLAAPGSAQQQTARLGLARNLSWSGQTGRAIREYRQYNRTSQDSAASLEFARLLRYRGDYEEAERAVSALLEAEPDNAMALALKSEILHFQGHRPHEAAALARRAIALRPDLREAHVAGVYALKDLGRQREAADMFAGLRSRTEASGVDAQQPYAAGYEHLLERVPAWGKMQAQLPYSVYNDTDGIRATSSGARLVFPVRDHGVWLSGERYGASAPSASVFSVDAAEHRVAVVSAGAALRVGSNAWLESSAGLASFSSDSRQGVFSAGFTGSPVDRWAFRFHARRDILAVSPKSIRTGLAFAGLQAGAEYHSDSKTKIGFAAERRFWNNGNKSVAGNAQMQRVLRRSKRFSVEAGPRLRIETFARNTTFASGAYTPDWYDCYQAFVGVHGELAGRVTYDVRPAIGAQRLASWADFRQTAEIASALSLKITRSLVFSANYQRRSYSVISGTGSYQGVYLQAGLQP
jgi:tetratricopeptide (TPR) repeat protein